MNENIPFVFREALSIMVTIQYDSLVGDNENSILVLIPFRIFSGRCLSLAWRRVGGRGM